MKKKTTATGTLRGEVGVQVRGGSTSPLTVPVEVVFFFILPVQTFLGVPYCTIPFDGNLKAIVIQMNSAFIPVSFV